MFLDGWMGTGREWARRAKVRRIDVACGDNDAFTQNQT
ncbi:MAG: hypothetical protein RI986_988, partial [Planctomycetota bacterium]